MAIEILPWSPLDHLETSEAQAAYLEAAIEEDDPSFVAVVLGDIAKVRGVDRLAGELGVSRKVIEENFREGGTPSIQLVFQVAKALGLRLRAVAA